MAESCWKAEGSEDYQTVRQQASRTALELTSGLDARMQVITPAQVHFDLAKSEESAKDSILQQKAKQET